MERNPGYGRQFLRAQRAWVDGLIDEWMTGL